MAENGYVVGQLVRLSVSFTATINGVTAPTDPSTVQLLYKSPQGVVTTLTYGVDNTLVKDSTGNYHADITPTLGGQWWYTWEGTGVCQAVSQNAFYAIPVYG